MFKNKIKLLILLIMSYKYCLEIIQVSCSDPSGEENPKEEGNNDLQSQVWSDQWKEQSKWQAQAQVDAEDHGHAQPLKREEVRAAVDLPSGSELTGLNLSDPITKFHCPLNLLYGNNLTVKNYFLVVPKCTETPNEVLKKFEVAGEERSEMIGANPLPQKAQGQSVLTGPAPTDSVSDGSETTASPGTADNASDVSGTTGTTGTPGTSNDSSESFKMSDTNAPTTVPTDITMTFFGSIENKTMEVVVDLFTSQITSASTPAANPSTSDDFMRTIDKYCETFNLSDQSTYTINPVSINTDVNVAAEDKNKQSLVEQTKHKRTPQCEGDCVKLNISGDETYTINPVAIPIDVAQLSAKSRVANLKKQKRTITSKRPRKIKRSKIKSVK